MNLDDVKLGYSITLPTRGHIELLYRMLYRALEGDFVNTEPEWELLQHLIGQVEGSYDLD